MTGPLRPKFSEGQILGAADLTAQVNYVRQGAVLHERTEHLWGVAQGLVLTTTAGTDSNGNAFVNVSISPGRAVDQLGRAIVVTTALPLQPSDFQSLIATPDKTKFYPVFVQYVETDQLGETQPGKCGVTLATRTEESLQVVYGNPGAELAVLDQDEATVDVDLDAATLTNMVLVGWVQFDTSIQSGQFIAVNTTNANGANIRYVGVVASDVVAGGGVLTLHTRPSGQRYVLSITENASGATLAFGKQNGSNPVVPTFSVDEKGNILAASLTPAPIAKTLADSGVIFDGFKVPLPPGVTADDLDNGARIHLHLTPIPHAPQLMFLQPAVAAVMAFPIALNCTADMTSDRIVHCQVRWYDPASPTHFIDLPSACSYLVVATGK